MSTTYEANIEVASTDAYKFTNASNNDVVFYSLSEAQRLHLGTKSNAYSGMTLASSNIAFNIAPVTTSGNISFYTGNYANQAMTIYGTGSVAVGTSNPLHRLQVWGGDTSIYSGGNTTDAGGSLHFGVSPGPMNAQFGPIASIQGRLSYTSTAYSNFSGGLSFNVRPSNFSSNTTMTEAMRITDQGNVGIGTTTPQVPFDIYETTAASTYLRTSNNVMRFLADDAANALFIQSGSNFTTDSRRDIRFSSFNAGTSYMAIQSSTGNVGVGTTNPQQKLHVQSGNIQYGAAGADYYIQTPGQAHIWANSLGSASFVHMTYSVGSNNSTGDHVFYTGGDPSVGGTERLRMSSNGYVGIGTNLAQALLQVNGNIMEGTTLLTNKYTAIAMGTANSNTAYWSSNNSSNLALKASPTFTGTLSGSIATLSSNLQMSTQITFSNNTSSNTPTIGWNGGTGDRIILYQGSGTAHPYSIGINASTMWYSSPSTTQHLWYIGGTTQMTLSNSNVGIGTNPATKLALYGADQNYQYGPHIQTYTSGDSNPLLQILSWQHNNINLCFDSYFAANWTSASPTNNYVISKASGILQFLWASNAAIGSNISNITGQCAMAINLGNVGIGTTNPAYKLDVVGTVRTSNLVIGTGSNDNNRLISALDSSTAAGGVRYFAIGKSASTYNQGEIAYTHYGDGSSANSLSLGLYGTANVLYVAATGNVGVGFTASNPAYKLDVAGTGRFTSGVVINNNTSLSALTSSGTTASIVSIDTTNNVRLSVGSNNANMYINPDINSATNINYNNSNSVSLYNGTTNIMSVNGTGVGIGTNAPLYKLDVNGTARANTIYIGSNGSSPNGQAVFHVSTPRVGGYNSNNFSILAGLGGYYDQICLAWNFYSSGNSEYYRYDNSNLGWAIINGASSASMLNFVCYGAGYIGSNIPVGVAVYPFQVGSNYINTLNINNSGYTGIGITSTSNNRLEINNTNTGISHIKLSGSAYNSNGGTSGEGALVSMGYNGTANRQIWFMDSANKTQNTTNVGARIVLTGTSATMDAISTDGTTNKQIQIGNTVGVYMPGNLGIGTSSPQTPLHICSSNTPQLMLQGFLGASAPVSIDFKTFGGEVNSAGRISVIDDTYGGHMAFLTKPGGTDANVVAERMRIMNSGNVGIGTTTPAYKLDVSGVINTSSNLLVSGNIGVGTTSAVFPLDIQTTTYGSTCARFGGATAVYISGYFPGVSMNTYFNSTSSVYGHTTGSQYAMSMGLNPTTGTFTIQNSTVAGNPGSNVTFNTGTTFLPSGNVGIGTTNPSKTLHVVGDALVTGTTAWNTFGNQAKLNLGDSNQAILAQFGLGLALQPNATTLAVVVKETSGNVGIGSTAPTQKLDVTGNIVASGAIAAPTINATSQVQTTVLQCIGGPMTMKAEYEMYYYADYDGNNGGAAHVFFSSSNEKVRIVSSGAVGIGTYNPTQLLDVNGHIKGKNLYLTSAVLGDGIIFNSGESRVFDSTTGPYGLTFNVNTASNFTFLTTGGVNRMTIIGSTGNVGIGTASPSAPLSVKPTSSTEPDLNGLYIFNPTNSANQHAIAGVRVAGSAAGNPFYSMDVLGETGWSMGMDNADNKFKIASIWNFTTLSTTTRMSLDNSGNMLVGNDITAFYSFSDSNLKENIIDLTGNLDKVKQMRPVEFNWKEDIYNIQHRGKHDIGLIAQDIERIVPEAVKEAEVTNGDTYKTIKYERLVPVLIGAIKELEKKNRALEEKVDALIAISA